MKEEMTTARSRPRPNMADVARLAEVSTQTVSRYFTGVGYVRAETRERIASAIDELGYIPNRSARNLRSQRSNSVGVLSLGALNHGASQVLTGLTSAARDAGVAMLISHLDLELDPDAEDWTPEARRMLDYFRSVQVDGIVISTVVASTASLLPDEDDSVPVMTLSDLPPTPDGSASAHSHAAGLIATEHLIGLGHRHIMHVAGPTSRNEAIERERGYRDAMRSAGLEPVVVAGAVDWSSTGGYTAGETTDPDSFTAVFAGNDEIALGFMSAMERRGRKAPADYSIIGVDDMPAAAFFSPPLTTMRLDFVGLGAATFRMLHHQILTGEHAAHYSLEPELIVRETTASPPR